MLEYCALNPRCSISCFQTSPSNRLVLSHLTLCQSNTTLGGRIIQYRIRNKRDVPCDNELSLPYDTHYRAVLCLAFYKRSFRTRAKSNFRLEPNRRKQHSRAQSPTTASASQECKMDSANWLTPMFFVMTTVMTTITSRDTYPGEDGPSTQTTICALRHHFRQTNKHEKRGIIMANFRQIESEIIRGWPRQEL